MKHLMLSIALLTTLSPLAANAGNNRPVAQTAEPAVIDYFKSVCNYDSLCSKVGRVKDDQLFYKLPAPAIMPYYANLRSRIIQIAHEYQIDPVSLVLAPLAENTMNVKKDKQYTKEAENMAQAPMGDKWQEDMDDNGLLDDDGAPRGLNLLYSRPLSLGPGQIYVHVAASVEELSMRIEHRNQKRSKKEIKAQIRTPEGALRYAAALIREAQDVYAKAGFDISNKPEILATLYNIGRPQERLQRTLQSSNKRLPAPNYFGLFAKLNYQYVKSELRL